MCLEPLTVEEVEQKKVMPVAKTTGFTSNAYWTTFAVEHLDSVPLQELLSQMALRKTFSGRKY